MTKINIAIGNLSLPHIIGAEIDKPYIMITYFDVIKIAKEYYKDAEKIFIIGWEINND